MKNKFIVVLIVILLITGIVWLIKTPGKSGKLDAFASCIKDSGAIFYGAFWCPHCQNQKAMFGSSAKLLPYVECSTPDGNSQLPLCTDAGVKGYPTWQFADGTRESGEVSLEKLSEKTNCPLPQE
jgi:thiol-disulfide isomerase/thioredoxin